MSALLQVCGIGISFGPVAAVKDVSFEVAAGEMLALIGPNGAGKSTCFNMLGGQLKPQRGEILLGGASIAGLSPRGIWRQGVGRTFQITASFASMTVRENIQMGLLAFRNDLWRGWRRAGHFYRDEAMALLAQVGLADQAERAAAVLAYGDVKRLELAMALTNAPRLLLMDEPTAGMASGERVQLMQLTRELARERQMAVLFTEHDMDVVFGVSDRIAVLNRGEMVAMGDGAEIRAHPRVREIYLGAGATSGGH